MTFEKGQSGNPKGRPKRLIEEKFLKKISSSVTITEWREIIKKAVDQAKRGDPRARQWLSEYLVGKPIQGIDLDTTDSTLEVIVKRAESRALPSNTNPEADGDQ